MKAFVFLVATCLMLIVFILPYPTVSAQIQGDSANFTLYGSAVPIENNIFGGWGYSIDTISSPGPTIMANQGDLLIINITSADNATHRFFVDYNSNQMPDAGEPDSGNFGPFNVSVIVQFTLNATGSFNYYCFHHPDIMNGKINAVIPEFPSTLMLAVLLMVVLMITLVYRRTNDRKKV